MLLMRYYLLVKAIQMSTHSICFYKEVDKKKLAVIKKLLNFWRNVVREIRCPLVFGKYGSLSFQ